MTTQTSPATDVVTELDSAVLTIALDGPKTRNSISAPVYKELQSAIIMAGENPEIRAIVLTGRHGFFSSGGNINALKASAQSTMAEVTGNTDALNAMIIAIRSCPTPVIAAVEGGAAGAGLSLALACDMIVASEEAKFTAAYVKAGLVPDGGLTSAMARLIPRPLAMEMCLLGRPVMAGRFADLGAVNRICGVGRTLGEAMMLADTLAAGPRAAQGAIRRMVADAFETTEAAQLDAERDAMARASGADEAAEGIAAFLEKRPPRFAG